MAEGKMMRLNQVARKLNVGTSTIVDFLRGKGHGVENKPNTKISPEQFSLLRKEFASSAMDKEEASGLRIGKSHAPDVVIKNDTPSKPAKKQEEEEELLIKSVGSSSSKQKKPAQDTTDADKASRTQDKPKKEEERIEAPKLKGIKVLGKVDLDAKPASKPAEEKRQPAKSEQKSSAEKPVKAEPAKAKKPEETKPKKSDNRPVKAQEPPVAEKPAQKPATTRQEPPKPKPEKKQSPEQPKAPETSGEVAKTPDKVKEKVQPVATEEEKVSTKEEAKEGQELIEAKADQLKGLTVLGKIELPSEKKGKKKPVASSDENKNRKKRRQRKRISKPGDNKQGNNANADNKGGADNKGRDNNNGGRQQGNGGNAGGNRGGGNRGGRGNFQGGQGGRRGPGGQGGPGGARRRGPGGRRQQTPQTAELTDKQIQEQIKQTLAKLSGGGPKKGGRGAASRSKYRKDKRDRRAEAHEERMLQEEKDARVLQVTEFISASDLASLMDVSVNDIISTCMSMGMFVSINQRLDAESISLIADEFGFDVNFNSAEDEIDVEEVEDKEDELIPRAPIVTIMGHVDHGKTSLLDYIRSAKVIDTEAGGITQHIGAYDVMTDSGKRVAFLDTPGHEAFTAMRARGAKVTDVVVIVVAADDNVMPQTKEAINHAQVAGVPIVIAINKVDKPNANPEKIREELANINLLVEDWGGKYQCQEISAKTGQGVDDLLEKILLEAEVLELTANPDKKAVGTVVEASLDKGRGYVATMLVQGGTLKVGDVMLAGQHFGKVKAMFDHLGTRLQEAPPATPVQVLGLDGAPQAGDRFNVMETDREAREIANKREQIIREQSIRTKKHITLDEIGRRLAIGSFKELNVIVKGDVDGSVEALSDSLLKLSTEEVQVNIIHKAVGQISESDVLLASASDAIVIGFQVRPSMGARKLAEQEQIEIRLYSIIYDAINELKDAMEGMLDPEMEEVITGNIEVREVFKISKVGTVAGCYVTEGFIKRNNQIRLIRDGIVTYTGDIGQLKRFKDDVSEVKNNYECGLSIKNFNDIKVGDVIEGFEMKEVKRKL
ncbi:hypothetical protein FUAX_27730 [Fulvitalea axinellae]|uniref:Translation initiation factor IF-2 n=1 Tax=Fulvitalea axinellae TaxID=1182444 RepID=A0AAU9CDZ2_9BACT|nr:hypothetical protein FUAX_27730 [Fulvitalea axinellae]